MRKGRLNLQLKKLNELDLISEAERLSAIHQKIDEANNIYNEMVSKINSCLKQDNDNIEKFKKEEAEHNAIIFNLSERIKSLNDEYNKSKDINEKLLLSISSSKEKEISMRNDIKRLTEEKNKIEEIKKSRTLEFDKTKTKYEELLRGLSEKIIKKRDELIDIDFKLDFSRSELDRITKKINEENVIIDKKRKDLEIYEERIKKQNNKIIL